MRNDNVRNHAQDVRPHGPIRGRTVPVYRVHKPVLESRYSGTVPCHKACTITQLYVQLHVDDSMPSIVDDVMIECMGYRFSLSAQEL